MTELNKILKTTSEQVSVRLSLLTFCESFHYKLVNSEEKNIFKCKSYNQMVNLQGNPPKLLEVYIITIKIMSEFLALLAQLLFRVYNGN